MLGQQEDILASFPERRRAELDDVQAVEEVLAEAVLADGLDDVAVGGGDQADLDAQLLVAAHAGEAAVLEEAEQLGLEGTAHVANFIQEDGAAVGLLDAPGLLAEAPVKDPFSWPKSSLSSRVSGIAAQLMRT